MADPMSYRPPAGSIPPLPGVYRFRDSDTRVVYVGKATNLRSRLSSYFQSPAGMHPRTAAMVQTASSVDWVVVDSETEALQLEYQWIKQFAPRFNVKYRDDKSYPYLAITMNEQYPRVLVMRGDKRKGVKYFGPYAQAWAIRETVDQVLRVFPVRTCSNGVFRRSAQMGRPCLLGYIGKCSAPCVGRISEEDHRELAGDLVSFLGTGTDRFMKDLENRMRASSQEQDYETAARLRDDLGALRKAMERSALVLPGDTNADLVGHVEDDLEAAFQVFHVRAGRVRGQHAFVLEKVADESPTTLMTGVMQQLYGDDDSDIPVEVLVTELPEAAVATWLTDKSGRRVQVRIPQRGRKRALLETVTNNAKQTLQAHKLRRAGDLSVRAAALEEIAEALEMSQAPLRIECVDISNLQGSDVVASMVVFEDGLPRKSDYRRFAIRGVAGQDDVASVAEVVRRRFTRYLAERAEATDIEFGPSGTANDERKAFRYPPQLLLIDGGKPQVAAAEQALRDLGIDDLAVAGLAKRLEEVWVPGQDDPVILSRRSQGLYLLQRIRDEAHRFAITYHRQKRSRRLSTSVVEDIPGVGPNRRKALMRAFGSLTRLRKASVEELAAVPGISAELASAIHQHLASEKVTPAVNVTTGEVIGEDGL
ncbi:MAG: excinuclease ABC subunit UvrC [Actinobacteria bacterium]|nr:excinuclease ABC subunit UvrC [Actinomycetota bacterium]MCO5300334.1 excinuclease ABC subunit UvrC [Candidatus Nanopelagicales bacterium]MCB9428516.1 excinuclease ABC subunit UvrC [Actinomycetota bacterium]HPE11878.1 excinuclease ABC subunit UvrC [Actinomycetota bacterium]HPQ83651.1 excinuclease ABC subunit UvrC [Actinomycetota bacterium]